MAAGDLGTSDDCEGDADSESPTDLKEGAKDGDTDFGGDGVGGC